MKKTNELGIWMDFSVAYLIEFTTNPFVIHTVVREFSMEEKNVSLSNKNESISSTKTSVLNKCYNEIGQIIIKYNEIVLFGPPDAKMLFFDFLSEDEQFWKLKVEIKDWISK